MASNAKWGQPLTLFAAAEQKPILTGKGSVWVEPVITPEHAQRLLDNLYPGQRALRPAHVARISRAMQDGKYEWTGDPFRVWAKNGQLLDGQHRLSACAATGIPLQNAVFVSLNDEEAMQYIDTVSAPRSLVDVQRVRGMAPVTGTVVAAIVLEFSEFSEVDAGKWTKPEKVEIVEACPYLEELHALYKVGRKVGLVAGPLAGVIRCLRANRDEAMRFLEAAFSNEAIIDGQPCSQARLLADYLQAQRGRRSVRSGQGGVRGDVIGDAYKVVQAYNCWRRGKSISKLQYSGGEVPKALP